jgi:RNA polymerase-interacting CarD/CdnL/TRCF family regulator
VQVKLSVGDVVVYGTHGVGRVVARKSNTVMGKVHDVVVVELEDELTVTLTVDRALEQLRPLASTADLNKIRAALREEHELSSDPWLTRKRDTIAKLTAGSPISLAEIVRDGAQRERALKARKKPAQLSPGEKELYLRAWALLADEISRARDVGHPEAEAWINEQLGRPKLAT